MWRILQQETPDDYVLATGETRSVREFVEIAFAEAGRRIDWQGEGVEEKGRDAKTGEILVEVDPKYFRPTEVELLLGDPAKAKARLGWAPSTSFADMVREMVASDLALMEKEMRAHGNEEPKLRAEW
jgi:GDPmannose 4,6-dehydratase